LDPAAEKHQRYGCRLIESGPAERAARPVRCTKRDIGRQPVADRFFKTTKALTGERHDTKSTDSSQKRDGRRDALAASGDEPPGCQRLLSLHEPSGGDDVAATRFDRVPNPFASE